MSARGVPAAMSSWIVWPTIAVDVVGTSPYAPDVTVCSLLDGPSSLPEHRWDTILVTDPFAD